MSFVTEDPVVLVRTVVVGVLAYMALVAILRVSGKRTLSQMNAFDFIVTVALGSTLASILTSRDVSIPQGVLALLVLVGLQFAITWGSIRSRTLSRLVKSEPRVLVYRGEALQDAMRRERVLETEILAALRNHGETRIEDVGLVVLETDGSFTVVPDLGPRHPPGVTGIPESGRREPRPEQQFSR